MTFSETAVQVTNDRMLKDNSLPLHSKNIPFLLSKQPTRLTTFSFHSQQMKVASVIIDFAG
jgi:hypothetical protein